RAASHQVTQRARRRTTRAATGRTSASRRAGARPAGSSSSCRCWRRPQAGWRDPDGCSGVVARARLPFRPRASYVAEPRRVLEMSAIAAKPRQTKFVLDESRIPRAWYNIAADLPSPPPPPLHPGTHQPLGPDDLAPLFPMALIGQEVSTEREIEIP